VVKKQRVVVQTDGAPPNTGSTSRPASSSRLKSRNAESPIAVTKGKLRDATGVAAGEIDGAARDLARGAEFELRLISCS
jgi:hypothetical protein